MDKYERVKEKITKNYSELFLFLICLIVAVFAILSETLYDYNIFTRFLPNLESEVNIDIPKNAAAVFIIISIAKFGGLFFNTLFTLKFDTEFLLSINFGLMIISNLLLIIFKKNFFIVIISWIAFNFALSAILPLLVALVEERLTLNAKKLAIIYFVKFVALQRFDYLTLVLVEEHPGSYYYVGLGLLILSYLLYCILAYILERKRLKATMTKNSQNSSHVNNQFTNTSFEESNV